MSGQRSGCFPLTLRTAPISEYLARHAPDEVTEAMNRVVDEVQEAPDPFVAEAARRTFERTEW